MENGRQLFRDVNEANKVRGRGRYHKAEVEAMAKKNCEAEAEPCEAEARDAVFTINY